MLDFDISRLGIPGIDGAAGTLTLPLWIAGIAAALLVLLLLVTLFRRGGGGLVAMTALALVAGGGFWLLTERTRMDERRALESRLSDLRALALASGSALACLDATSGDTVEAGCERVIFSSPESVAAAASYSGARFSLLSDGLKFAARDPEFEPALDSVRRALEQDRFGVVANVLAVDSGCTADACDALALLRDPARVQTNLKERTFETIVARYKANWDQRQASGPSGMTTGTAPMQPSFTESLPPSGAFSPAVPTVEPPPTLAPGANTAVAPLPVRRPAPPAARPPARSPANGAPVQISPSRVQ